MRWNENLNIEKKFWFSTLQHHALLSLAVNHVKTYLYHIWKSCLLLWSRHFERTLSRPTFLLLQCVYHMGISLAVCTVWTSLAFQQDGFCCRLEGSNERQYFLAKINKAGIGIDWRLILVWHEGLSSSTKKLFEKSSLRIVDAVIENSVGFFTFFCFLGIPRL